MNRFDATLRQAKKQQQRRWLGMGLTLCGIAVTVVLILHTHGVRVQVLPPQAAAGAQIQVLHGLGMVSDTTLWSLSDRLRLRITAPGFEALETVAEPGTAGPVLQFRMRPLPARIMLQGIPQSADTRWEVDGQVLGKMPTLKHSLPAGSHRIAFDNPYYQAGVLELELDPGESFQTQVRLEPLEGQLHVLSEPAGATVTVDGQNAGQTPLKLPRPGGEYALRLHLEGYQPAADTVAVTRATLEPKRRFLLRPLPARLTLELEPRDGTLLLNGIRTDTGQPLQLDSGREHHVSYGKPGYIAEGRSIRLQPNEERRIRFQLQPQPVAAKPPPPPPTPPPSPGRPPQRYQNSVGATLQLHTPAGTLFQLGAPRHEEGQRANEQLRSIRLQRPFYIGLHELSQAQYQRFDPNYPVASPDHPAVSLSWRQAAAFCNWLSQQEGLQSFYKDPADPRAGFRPEANGYRLPSEAEWEWLARGKNKARPSRFVWGDSVVIRKGTANIADVSARGTVKTFVPGYNDGYAQTAPIGSFQREASGLYDQGGNASEWVHDYYSIRPYDTIPIDPLGQQTGHSHVVKGASWRSGTLSELRAAFREGLTEARDDVGFRLARYAGKHNETRNDSN